MQRFIGDWEVEVTSMVGGETSPWKFYEKDGYLTGEFFLMGNNENLGEIVITDNAFEAHPTVNTPVGRLDVTVSGTIDGDHIQGTADGGMMVMQFDGHRK